MNQQNRDLKTWVRLTEFSPASFVFFVLVATIVAVPTKANSQSDPSQICVDASRIVAEESGVPFDVLLAISLTETGRTKSDRSRPWPWTVNMEGKGYWFESEDDARAYVYEHFKRGARSFDVGCFQLNYKWHHEGFSSIDEMFDPLAGGRYAAKFLSELFSEKGTWEKAAGAYHSRTPEYAERYIAKFDAHLNVVREHGPPPASDMTVALAAASPAAIPQRAPATPRVNTFPLLQTGQGSGSAGSLVPLRSGTQRTSLVDLNGTR